MTGKSLPLSINFPESLLNIIFPRLAVQFGRYLLLNRRLIEQYSQPEKTLEKALIRYSVAGD